MARTPLWTLETDFSIPLTNYDFHAWVVFWRAQLTTAICLIFLMILLTMMHYCLYLSLSSGFIWKVDINSLTNYDLFPPQPENYKGFISFFCNIFLKRSDTFFLCISLGTSTRFFSCGSRSLRTEALVNWVHRQNRCPMELSDITANQQSVHLAPRNLEHLHFSRALTILLWISSVGLPPWSSNSLQSLRPWF